MTQTLPYVLPIASDDNTSLSPTAVNSFNKISAAPAQASPRKATQDIIADGQRNIDSTLEYALLRLEALRGLKLAQITAIADKYSIK